MYTPEMNVGYRIFQTIITSSSFFKSLELKVVDGELLGSSKSHKGVLQL